MVDITFDNISPAQNQQYGKKPDEENLKKFISELWEAGGEARVSDISKKLGLTKSQHYSITNILTYFKITIDGDSFVLAEDSEGLDGSRTVVCLVPAAHDPITNILTNNYIVDTILLNGKRT